MNKALITIVTMLGILMFPLNAMAADRDSSKHRAGDLHESRHDRHHDSRDNRNSSDNQERHAETRKERHQDWKQHREHRRAVIKHRQIEKRFNGHSIKTNHLAVKKRVAAHRIKHQRNLHRANSNWVTSNWVNDKWVNSHQADSRWKRNRRNDSRFLSRRDFYNHYYGRGNSQHYDRHREHYLSHNNRRNRDRDSHRHQHDNSYLEWIAIMALLNNIYDDENY